MSKIELCEKLKSFPRFPLLPGPTPLLPLENLSRELGIELFIKRDDLTGLAAGGNKTRKLEFLIGRALQEKADTILTAGWYHSNHALQTAAAAGKAGLDAILFLKGEPHFKGSLFLDYLAGADIRLFDVPGSSALTPYMEEAAAELRRQGKKPFIIPVGGSNPTGALGYAAGALELAEQSHTLDMEPDYVVMPTSSGGTHSGLLCGLRETLPGTRVLGIGVGDEPEEVREDVLLILQGLSEMLGLAPWNAEDITENFCFDYGFGDYGKLVAPVMELIREVGSKEGFYLDPVYTGKAFFGLLDLVKNGTIPKGAKVVFVHTGGLSGLFQYEEEVMAILHG